MRLRPLHICPPATPAASGSPSRPDIAGHRLVSAFTVIELLIVIGVLSVLLAIVLPTIKTVRAAVLRNRAEAGATALAQAAIRYKNVYGFWPGQLKEKDDDTAELRPEFRGLSGFIPVIISGPQTFTSKIQSSGGSGDPIPLNENEVCQSFRRTGNKDGALFKPNPLNPKSIQFLELSDETEREKAGFADPWGRNYVLFMGLNPGSTFTRTVTIGTAAYTFSVKNTIAFAFSFGPDGESSTNLLFSAGAKP